MRKLHALVNLACHFFLHLLHLALRAIGRRPRGLAAFRGRFAAEGIFSVAREERNPANCILCGLCDMGPGAPQWTPYGREALASTFPRLLPGLPVCPEDVARTGETRPAAAFCPMGVPLDAAERFVTRPRT